MNKRREAASVPYDRGADAQPRPSGTPPVPDADAGPDDTDLVARAREGDNDAFRLLFERYRRRAYSVAYGVLHDQEDALDAVQDGFIKAHRNLKGFEGGSTFYTWLYRIVMNVSIDKLRKRKRAGAVEYDDAVAHLEDDTASLASGAQPGAVLADVAPSILRANPGEELYRTELRAKLEEALAKLSENHRAVLLMREMDGMSYEEMAAAMGCSKGTIMSRLFHARKYMQKHLMEYLGKEAES